MITFFLFLALFNKHTQEERLGETAKRGSRNREWLKWYSGGIPSGDVICDAVMKHAMPGTSSRQLPGQ